MTEEPAVRVQSRPRWPLEPFPFALPDRLKSVACVGEQLAVDGVADASLQGAHRFFAGLALCDLAQEVDASGRVVRDLGDRGDVQRVVEPAVSSRVEPVTHARAR